MVWAAALVLAAAWPGVPTDVFWSWSNLDGSKLWVKLDDITEERDGGYSVWLHSYSPRTGKVPPRSSINKLKFDCKGNATYLAATTYNGLGHILKNWDGYSTTIIRPETSFAHLEKTLCK